MDSTGRNIIVVGASAGGVTALQRLLGGLPPDLPAAIFVVIHIWPGTESSLPAVLQRSSQLTVVAAHNEAPIEQGKVYIAPSDCHLMLEPGRLAVLRGPKENRTRPAINPLFRSAATAYRNRVIGVILTGTMDDGSAGLWAIKQCGGIAVVQSDPEFSDMPRNALENVTVDYHIPLDEIPRLLTKLTREAVDSRLQAPIPQGIRISDDAAKLKDVAFDIDNVGRRTIYTCPECNGALWEMDQGALEYRCHVGHAYGPAVLRLAQDVTIEQALWSAIRALKESAAFDERLADRSAEHHLPAAAESHRANARSKMFKAEQLQQFFTAGLPED